jgi:transposase-like protein
LGPAVIVGASLHSLFDVLGVVDGAQGLENAFISLWSDLPIQRCTVHKLRNLTAHAPKRLAEEIKADFNDMVYAATAAAVMARRKAFLRKWRLKCRAVADSLEEAGDQLFTFTRLSPSQWKSARTTNAIERLHEVSVGLWLRCGADAAWPWYACWSRCA